MADTSKFTPEMASFFNVLPKYIQESIVQSKDRITNFSELKSIAENIGGKRFQ